jgi:S1-C subfamily serine protease
MARLAAALAAAAALGLLGCGGARPMDATPLGDELAEPAATVDAPAPAAPRLRSGTIDRADLDAVLDDGIGRYLATFEVRARVVEGHFAGWIVVRSPRPDLDLDPGDVVVSVNGHALERPLELEALWLELRSAEAVVVEVERLSERFELSFAVVSQGTAAGPSEAGPAPAGPTAP